MINNGGKQQKSSNSLPKKVNRDETAPDIFNWFRLILWAQNQNFGAVRSLFPERNWKSERG